MKSGKMLVSAGLVVAMLLVFALAAGAEECKKCTKCTKCSEKCTWVRVTVSNDTEVWWGNRAKAYGNYIKFAKAEIPPPKEPPAPKPRKFDPIYFDLDKSVLRPDGIKTAEEILAYLKDHPQMKLRIEGNCCDLAPNDYNMRLGQRRADSVMKYLVDRGIDPDRIETKSYGEERRVTTEPSERPLNRRADAIALPPKKNKKDK